MRDAAIVLCGGRSRRMGSDKASLRFGDESMLERVVRIVSDAVDEVIVVAREGQDIEGGFQVVRDPAEGLGPLAGLAAGLAGITAARAFATSCDAPLLKPAYVRHLLALADGHEAAVPFLDGYYMTTSAVYSRSVQPVAQRLVDERRLRPLFLVQQVDARVVTAEEISEADPDFESLLNCNTPEDYQAALRKAGLG